MEDLIYVAAAQAVGVLALGVIGLRHLRHLARGRDTRSKLPKMKLAR